MLKRAAIFVHRWLGVALCLFFLLWFPTGIVLMYWDFPSVTTSDRLSRSPTLDPATIKMSPAAAYATLELPDPPDRILLSTFDGRPVYRFSVGRGQAIVYADTGDQQIEVTPELMQRAAATWTGLPASVAMVKPIDIDQWTIEGELRNLRPLLKYSWPDGQQVYVSQVNGEVVQYTTRRSRFWAYLGAIPHWFYFTPLRKHGPQWSTVVIWSSAIGTFSALLGALVGIWMYSPSRRYRYRGAPTSIPYRGQKRWHMLLGLVFGLAAATWAFSGMLSMDPFPARRGGGNQSRNGGGLAIFLALRESPPLMAFNAAPPTRVLSGLVDLHVKQLELRSVLGEPVYLATLGSGETRVVSLDGALRTEFNHGQLVNAVARAAESDGPAEVTVLHQYDRYYLDRRRERPLPVILARLSDPEGSRYYIDPKTARVVGTYSSERWVSRWLYHGLHSFDFPWLYNNRPLWDVVVIVFMLGGTALSVTSIILAWRVIGRKLTFWPAGSIRAADNEDLVGEAR